MPFFQIAVAALALLEGSVRDAQHRAVGRVTVTLQMENGSQRMSAVTDSEGHYRFEALHPGSYLLRVNDTTIGPFSVAAKDAKSVDVTVSAGKLLEFSDEPTFTVAGVTDASSHGGHGSDTILRSGETLAEATTALGKKPSAAAPLEAVREYQRAAELDASEANLFDWGAELLRHRAALQAEEVFAKGTRLYATSVRMRLGLGAAKFSLGAFEGASTDFLAASDLDPNDAEPYLFMGKVQAMEVMESEGLRQRLGRFAKLHPENALANYYYGASLWRHDAPEHVETLLKTAIALDPKLAEAHLSLGMLYADQKDFPKAIAAYKQAIVANPGMEQAHYRLGQTYMRTKETTKANDEFALYRQLSRTAAEEAERKRSEIQEFVFDLKRAQ